MEVWRKHPWIKNGREGDVGFVGLTKVSLEVVGDHVVVLSWDT